MQIIQELPANKPHFLFKDIEDFFQGVDNRLKFWPIRVKQPISYYFHYFVYFPCISDVFGIILLNLLQS